MSFVQDCTPLHHQEYILLRMLFRFFFSDNIIEEILSCTNLQGRRAATQWNAIQKEEFLVFVGMLLLAGIKKI